MDLTRRRFAAGSIAAAAAAPVAALVTAPLARPALADTSPIVIGYPAALTGPSSAPGVGNNRGVTYAVEMINAAGGVKGRKIEMLTRDTQGDPTKAVNAVQEMMGSATVHAIWGPNNSGESLATTPIISRRGIPNIHECGINSLIDPVKYPNAYRIGPNNGQSGAAPRIYCLNILKATNVAVIGDSTGYGTIMVKDSVEDFKQNHGNVVYQAQIDATQLDMMPDLLRMRGAGAQAIVVWTVSTGMIARLLNARAAMAWDVPFVGHPAMGSGEVGKLLDKPENWNKVYILGFKNCSYDAAGKLPPHTQAFVDSVKGKIRLDDTSLWWVVSGVDAINLIAKAVAETGSSASEAIIGYWNTVTRYPGLFGTYTYTKDQHNGFPTDELVMSQANSARDGAFTLAPGYA
jgi:branched-chain amino acid transport system substrate-binding protein